MTIEIAAVVLAFDEVEMFSITLPAIKALVDQVVVVDMGSTDGSDRAPCPAALRGGPARALRSARSVAVRFRARPKPWRQICDGALAVRDRCRPNGSIPRKPARFAVRSPRRPVATLAVHRRKTMLAGRAPRSISTSFASAARSARRRSAGSIAIGTTFAGGLIQARRSGDRDGNTPATRRPERTGPAPPFAIQAPGGDRGKEPSSIPTWCCGGLIVPGYRRGHQPVLGTSTFIRKHFDFLIEKANAYAACARPPRCTTGMR